MQCKYCALNFQSMTVSAMANHTRWCDKRPGREEHDKKHSEALSKSADKRWGKHQMFEVVCDTCNKKFQVKKRNKCFDPNATYHCSRTCANSKGGRAHSEQQGFTGRSSYRDIAFKIYGSKACLVCGFDKVVEVHHVDHNHDNNVKGNIVILCPNHHMMIHRSKYAAEVKADIQRILGD